VKSGHSVTGVARSSEKTAVVRELGATPVLADLFDPGALARSLDGHEVVCNFATRIPVSLAGYVRGRGWRANSRLHRDASRFLVDAAISTGALRFLQHSIAFQYADGGDGWIDEDGEVLPPPHGLAVLEAERQAQRFTESGGVGLALRFGLFYGDEAPNTRGLIQAARRGFVSLPGPSAAYLSWIHTDDLGSAVVAALEAPAGVFNVVDDEPITRTTWADVLARALGRKRVRPFPRSFSRLIPKRYDYLMRSQRISNRRFRSASAWSPSIASPREGWPQAIAALAS
jgi:nucleoside-diphosphate-sugar epimerase